MSVFQVQKLQFGASDSDSTVMLTNRKHHDISVDVTYDPCGGYFLDDESTENRTLTYTLAKKYKSMPEAKKDGFGFQGWYTEPSSLNEQITKDSIVRYDISVLYAYWVAGYTVINDSPGQYPIKVVTDSSYYIVPAGQEVQGLLDFSIEREDGQQFSHIDVFDENYNQLTTLYGNESYTADKDLVVQPFAGYRINQAYGMQNALTVEFQDYYNDYGYWSSYDSIDALSDVITMTRIDDYACTYAVILDDNYYEVDYIYLDNQGYCEYTLTSDIYMLQARASFTIYLNSYSGGDIEINYSTYSNGTTLYDVDYLYLGNSTGYGIYEIYDGSYSYSTPAQNCENYSLYRNENNSFSIYYYYYYMISFNSDVDFTVEDSDGNIIQVYAYSQDAFPCGRTPEEAYFYIPTDCPISYMEVYSPWGGSNQYYPGDVVYLSEAYTYVSVTSY